MRILLILILAIIPSVIYGQTDMQQEILGTWKFVKKTEVVQNTSKDVFLNKDVILWFRDTASLAFEPNEASVSLIVSYAVKDSILSIVDRTYHILKMDKHVLHFKRTDSLQTTYQYQRIKK